MSSEYRVIVHAESVGELPRSGKRREAVFRFFEHLETHQHLETVVQYTDAESRRTYYVSTVAGFAITW